MTEQTPGSHAQVRPFPHPRRPGLCHCSRPAAWRAMDVCPPLGGPTWHSLYSRPPAGGAAQPLRRSTSRPQWFAPESRSTSTVPPPPRLWTSITHCFLIALRPGRGEARAQEEQGAPASSPRGGRLRISSRSEFHAGQSSRPAERRAIFSASGCISSVEARKPAHPDPALPTLNPPAERPTPPNLSAPPTTPPLPPKACTSRSAPEALRWPFTGGTRVPIRPSTPRSLQEPRDASSGATRSRSVWRDQARAATAAALPGGGAPPPASTPIAGRRPTTPTTTGIAASTTVSAWAGARTTQPPPLPSPPLGRRRLT